MGLEIEKEAWIPHTRHRSVQFGATQIYRGVMAFFRNAAGHNIIETYSQEDALRFVVFADLLLAMVGEASEEGRDGSEA